METSKKDSSKQHVSSEEKMSAFTSLPDPEQYTIVDLGRPLKGIKKKTITSEFEDTPLVDTTASLTLNSKKTKRLEKQQLKKQTRRAGKHNTTNLLDLPAELLLEILFWLRPSDLFVLRCASRSVHTFIAQHEGPIARRIIKTRYPVLSRCFPLPVSARPPGDELQKVLLDERRLELLSLHRKLYSHIRPINPYKVCSCLSCLFCWNNLCLILDFAHFQEYLENRTPIPIIPRGENPDWNIQLIERHASIVEKAIFQPLLYAAILERHLQSIIGTLIRKHLVHRQTRSANGKFIDLKEMFLRPVYRTRPYQLTDAEAELESDFFLERQGRPSYEFPYHRDNYYNLEVYVPNRKWVKEEERWRYYEITQHDKEVALAAKWFGSSTNNKPTSTVPKVGEATQSENVRQNLSTTTQDDISK